MGHLSQLFRITYDNINILWTAQFNEWNEYDFVSFHSLNCYLINSGRGKYLIKDLFELLSKKVDCKRDQFATFKIPLQKTFC